MESIGSSFSECKFVNFPLANQWPVWSVGRGTVGHDIVMHIILVGPGYRIPDLDLDDHGAEHVVLNGDSGRSYSTTAIATSRFIASCRRGSSGTTPLVAISYG